MKKPHGIPCEYEYLLHLLRCAVHGAVPEPIPDGVSFEQVLQYGMKHEVANIAFLAVKKLKTPPDETLLQSWQEQYMRAVKRDALQQKARADIPERIANFPIDKISERI